MNRPRWLLPAIVGGGCLLRLILFTGFAAGDDVFYHLQAIAHGLDGAWPPEPFHWQTRLGITLPTAALIRLGGLHHWTLIGLPLAASTAGIYVTYLIARDFTDRNAALLAAAFQACYPLELIYATHLFPDVPVGLLQSLSLWLWIRGLRHDRAADYAAAGLCFGAGYLCRETIVMSGPAYLGLWLLFGRWRRPAVSLAVLLPLLVVAAEVLLYWATTGDPQYRLAAITAQQSKPENLALVSQGVSGGGFWTDPLLMLATNQEFGAFQVALVPVLIVAWRRYPQMRPLVVWWLALFVWSFYGTTTPNAYITLQRDPRYAAALTVPTVILLGHAVSSLSLRPRIVAAAGLAAAGVFGAMLDQGTALIAPHKAFVQSRFATDAALEPLEYYGSRWHSGLDRPATYKCVIDLGRESSARLMAHVPSTEYARSTDVRYVVFSQERRPDLRATLRAAGWNEVASFRTPASHGRRLLALLLNPLPGQRERAARIGSTPSLRVFENPARRD